MDQFKQIIVIGCMAFSDTKRLVHVIGHVGMEQPLSSCALVVFCTMNTLILAIGPKMLKDAKNIVSTV